MAEEQQRCEVATLLLGQALGDAERTMVDWAKNVQEPLSKELDAKWDREVIKPSLRDINRRVDQVNTACKVVILPPEKAPIQGVGRHHPSQAHYYPKGSKLFSKEFTDDSQEDDALDYAVYVINELKKRSN